MMNYKCSKPQEKYSNSISNYMRHNDVSTFKKSSSNLLTFRKTVYAETSHNNTNKEEIRMCTKRNRSRAYNYD